MSARAAPRLPDDVLADIQGFITSGYGHLSHAAYFFVQFQEAGPARRWLALMAPAITSAKAWPTTADGKKLKPAVACNIAFTADGLAALRLPSRVLSTFPRRIPGRNDARTPFDNSRRYGRERPGQLGIWRHQGVGHSCRRDRSCDLGGCAERACEIQGALLAATEGGVAELAGTMQSGYRPDADHEPFGFHDGIAQPSIAGVGGRGVPTGEFILGYQIATGS